MKTLFAVFAASLLAITASQAQDTHYSLVVHGDFRYVSTTGSINSIVTVPITNKLLLEPFVSGTTTPAKDLDLVIDSVTAEIDVIKKPATTSGTATVLAVLGDPSNANTLGEVHSNKPKKQGGFEVIDDYDIDLPSSYTTNTPAVTSLFLTLGVNKKDSNEFADIKAAQFAGGYGEGTANCYIISGVASTTSKEYTY